MDDDALPLGLTDPARYADGYGRVATTASMTVPQLQAAYYNGCFPWTDNPVGWFCPHHRAVLLPKLAHFPKNLPKLIRRGQLTVRWDTDFAAVMRGCHAAHAHDGVWITPRFLAAYGVLHRLGMAHSIAIYQHDTLVGGLYGVQMGRVFSAESMFGLVNNASKVAVFALMQACDRLGIALVDVQVRSEATAQLGAVTLPQSTYLHLVHTLRDPKGPKPTLWPQA